MNVIDAAHAIGHEYPGGAQALAVRMNIGATVFNNKLNPNTNTHHLTLVESVRMQQLTGRADVLYAMADALGFVVIPKPQVSDDDLMQSMGKACAEFGDFMRQVNDTMQDGKVSKNELKKVQRELVEMIAAASQLNAVLTNRAGK